MNQRVELWDADRLLLNNDLYFGLRRLSKFFFFINKLLLEA